MRITCPSAMLELSVTARAHRACWNPAVSYSPGRSAMASLRVRGTRIVAASPLLAIPDIPPACFRHWRRQAPVPLDAAMASPSQVQCCTHQITARARRACSVPKGKHPIFMGCFPFGIRQCPTLPGRHQPSTIGAERLNFCVRYGNRWIPFAITTGMP